MKLLLFTEKVPEGRCLILAQKLSQATTLPPARCVALAEQLFAFAYKRDNPALIEVSESGSVADLTATCADFGITVETVQ
jgi:hypothetical protein